MRSARTERQPAAYAATTKVPVAKTTAEIGALLEKIGASQRGVMVDDDNTCAVVMFVLNGARYRIDVPLPKWEAPKVLSLGGKVAADKLHEQATRSRWRGVFLLLKAKIEAVRLGLSSYEDEFMASLILPNGRTVKESVGQIIKDGLAGGPPQLEGYHGQERRARTNEELSQNETRSARCFSLYDEL